MKEQPRRMLPSLDAYLDRIGVCDVQPATLEFLDELIYAHQRTVPFDNLDVYEKHLVPSLQVPDLFDKIVVRKRGGYCFELNALFNALLLELGFDSRPCMARVLFRPVPYFHISHRANFVRIDGRDYLADVGFGGPMPSFALPVEDGATRIGRGQAFAMHRYDDYWWDVGYTGGGGQEQRVLRVCVMPVDEPDFVPLSFFQACAPDSPFRLNRMANVRTQDGACNLRNMTFTEFRAGERTVIELEDERAVATLLQERFGIRL